MEFKTAERYYAVALTKRWQLCESKQVFNKIQ